MGLWEATPVAEWRLLSGNRRRESPPTVKLASVAEAGPVDAELAHLRPQRMRIDLQHRGGALTALDASGGGGKRRFDVAAHGSVERLDGRGGSSAAWPRNSILARVSCRIFSWCGS